MSDKHTLAVRMMSEKGISLSEELTHHQYFVQASEKLNMTPGEFTGFLWNQYHPSNIWMVIFAIGIVAAIMLAIYSKFILKKTDY